MVDTLGAIEFPWIKHFDPQRHHLRRKIERFEARGDGGGEESTCDRSSGGIRGLVGHQLASFERLLCPWSRQGKYLIHLLYIFDRLIL